MSMKFNLLMNVRIPIIVGILIFISRINTTTKGLKQEKSLFISIAEISCSVELSMKKVL